MEGENPTRRYKWFRPRQAARFWNPHENVASAYTTLYLYNNSTGPHVLVVRDIYPFSSNDNVCYFAYERGFSGSVTGTIVSLYPGEALPPGQLYYEDRASAISPDYQFPLTITGNPNPQLNWNHNFPFAVIPPGWSLVLQNGGTADGLGVAGFYEYVTIDQIDFNW